jgi:hypothetical protein
MASACVMHGLMAGGYGRTMDGSSNLVVEVVVPLTGPEYQRLNKEARAAGLSLENYIALRATEVPNVRWLPIRTKLHLIHG